jgi:hypothetical protein
MSTIDQHDLSVFLRRLSTAYVGVSSWLDELSSTSTLLADHLEDSFVEIDCSIDTLSVLMSEHPYRGLIESISLAERDDSNGNLHKPMTGPSLDVNSLPTEVSGYER